jgi:hypothetical protein
MADQAILTTAFTNKAHDNMVSQFRQEFLSTQALYKIQPDIVHRFLEVQAMTIAESIIQGLPHVKFSLPDRVSTKLHGDIVETLAVPPDWRVHTVGGKMDRLIRSDLRALLRSRFMELERSLDPAISTSAVLLRYSLVRHMVHNMLPAGRNVQFTSTDGEEIPSVPISGSIVPAFASAGSSFEKTAVDDENLIDSYEQLVPYVEAARRFYIPKWVCFDDEGHLLAGSVNEAEAEIVSMQRYASILYYAVSIAPFVVADDIYQQKRYGILGQLVNQGRALAHYQVNEIICNIKNRAAIHDLDRGLSLSLPYFNDQTLKIEHYDFDIIPSGRVMFVPAFVVLAVRAQAAKVAQNTRLSHSTRRQILMEFGMLEKTFLR